MKSNKGFSLIEIIIAIALLGIICIGMLYAMSGQFILMRRTRTMTESLFQAQQLIEQQIEAVKQSVKDGTTPPGTKIEYTLFSGANQRVVHGYSNTVEVNNGTSKMQIYAVAAEMKPLLFDVPSATDVAIEFYNGSILQHSYTSTPSMYVRSNFTKVDPQNVFLMGIHRWYVSRTGFNTPDIKDPFKKFEIEIGTVYPRFPDDYTLITGAAMKDLTTIKSNYAGRHLLYTITPAATSGKMGATEISNAVFISGLPVTTDLVLHLDASMILIDDTDVSTGSLREVTTGPIGNQTTQYFVKQWKDISGNLTTSNNFFKAIQTISGLQPELVQIKMGDIIDSGKTYESYAKYLRFSGAQGMTIAHDNRLNLNNITVFAVTRSTSVEKNKTIVSKMRNTSTQMDTWHLGWDMGDETTPAVDNRLAFYVRATNNVRISTAVEEENMGLDGNWHVLTGTSQYNADASLSKTTLQMDNRDIVEDERPFSNAIVNNSPITIGFNNGKNPTDPPEFSTVDIAEIIIYNGKLNDADIAKVQEYLSDKHQPVPPVVSIYSLQEPLDEVLVVGSTYELPKKLKANMSNGTVKDVDVDWMPATTLVDTSTAGTKTFTANALANPSKTKTLKVEISGINSLDDVTITLLQNTIYSLPTQVTAILDNGKSKAVDVTWNDPSIDTSIIGLSTRIATAVLDTSKTMTLRVDIVPVSATSVSINKTSTTLKRNQSETLIATVLPNIVSNKNVVWSSDNTSVVEVSSTGLITGKTIGTAQITAMTEDGKFVATCDVVVNKNLQDVLDQITTLVVNNPTNTNNPTRPSITYPFSLEGIDFRIISTSNPGRFDVSTGQITRRNNQNTTITVTLQGNDNGYTLNKIFEIFIPSNNTTPAINRTITVTVY